MEKRGRRPSWRAEFIKGHPEGKEEVSDDAAGRAEVQIEWGSRYSEVSRTRPHAQGSQLIGLIGLIGFEACGGGFLDAQYAGKCSTATLEGIPGTPVDSPIGAAAITS